MNSGLIPSISRSCGFGRSYCIRAAVTLRRSIAFAQLLRSGGLLHPRSYTVRRLLTVTVKGGADSGSRIRIRTENEILLKLA